MRPVNEYAKAGVLCAIVLEISFHDKFQRDRTYCNGHGSYAGKKRVCGYDSLWDLGVGRDIEEGDIHIPIYCDIPVEFRITYDMDA